MNTEDREKDIALVYKDIQYIKQDMAEIKASLKLVLEHYITRQDVEEKFTRLQTEVDKRFDGVHTRIDTKCDSKEVDKITSTLSRLNWIVITSVMMALLGLVITNFTK